MYYSAVLLTSREFQNRLGTHSVHAFPRIPQLAAVLLKLLVDVQTKQRISVAFN